MEMCTYTVSERKRCGSGMIKSESGTYFSSRSESGSESYSLNQANKIIWHTLRVHNGTAARTAMSFKNFLRNNLCNQRRIIPFCHFERKYAKLMQTILSKRSDPVQLFRIRPCKKFQVRSGIDPDPQHCGLVQKILRKSSCNKNSHSLIFPETQ